ncbi:hypothetical protein BJV78DRAFT_335910 [Lactifluus subvellereus]|nr:hypothetical protein BJV78DRAFT_335910 [Lactifluus subvellereus]
MRQVLRLQPCDRRHAAWAGHKKTPLGVEVERCWLVSDNIMVGMPWDWLGNNKACRNGCMYLSPHPTLSGRSSSPALGLC